MDGERFQPNISTEAVGDGLCAGREHATHIANDAESASR